MCDFLQTKWLPKLFEDVQQQIAIFILELLIKDNVATVGNYPVVFKQQKRRRIFNFCKTYRVALHF